MGTKSYLGYREGNNVIWVECLHDGYPKGIGKVLLKYYSDDERAQWLCETGNETGCTINSIYDHEYDFYKGRFFKMFDTYITLASSEGRGRDHGTMDVRKYKEVSPYAYLFEDGRWLVKGYSKDTDGYKHSDWVPLEEVLSQGIVESRRYRRDRMLRESASEWFNEYGWLLKDIPEECVRDIAQPGSADSAAEMWVDELDFKVPREKAIKYLYEYGAWDKEELEAKSDKELAMTCLWLGAWDIAENGEWLGLVH